MTERRGRANRGVRELGKGQLKQRREVCEVLKNFQKVGKGTQGSQRTKRVMKQMDNRGVGEVTELRQRYKMKDLRGGVRQ